MLSLARKPYILHSNVNHCTPLYLYICLTCIQIQVQTICQNSIMDDLPSDVLLNIFARLPDSTDLAKFRLTSRRLLSLSYLVSSISLQPSKCHNPIPFKTRVINLASLLASSLRSISITAKLDDNAISELNDLTDDDFLSAWLPLLGTQLQSLSLSNSWTKSRAGFSSALAVISDTC